MEREITCPQLIFAKKQQLEKKKFGVCLEGAWKEEQGRKDEWLNQKYASQNAIQKH